MPFDLGSTTFSGISPEAYKQLKAYLGIDTSGEQVIKKSNVVLPDEQVLEHFNIDTRSIMPQAPDTWDPTGGEGTRYPDGVFEDEWGIIRKKPDSGDTYSLYRSPLAGEATLQRLDAFSWPDPSDPGRIHGLREKATRFRQKGDYAIVGHYSADIVLHSQYLRGFEEWYIDLIDNRAFLEALLDRVLDFFIELGRSFFTQVGDLLDVVTLVDDVSGNDGPLISPEMYREIIKPRHQRLSDFVHSQTNAKLLFHCCGAVRPFMHDFLDLGIDALNPVQVSAAGMGDTVALKRDYGDKIAFWGGIDTTRVLPFGTSQDVYREVQHRIADLAPGGGYVLNAVHNIRPEVPAENICAMYDAGMKYGLYH